MQELEETKSIERRGWAANFFVREDQTYDAWERTCRPNSAFAKSLYLVMYILPGLVAALAINVRPLFEAELRVTHLSPRYLQLAWLLFVTFGWHMLSPFLLLRSSDRLSFRQSLLFLGLNRIDLRGLLLVLPIFCAAFALVSVPYMEFVWVPLRRVCQSVPLFHIPAWSIFGGDPKGFYAFPPFALLLLFIGNFLGEELYFRGYLMKKSSFLGGANWVVNSWLFALYHLWQIPQTWPAIGLIFAFGLLMRLRKDLYVLVAFHLFVNMWLMYGESPLARLLHLHAKRF
ncbi:MAG TPA: CPBP family intramembrane glutamic endopeptidase [Acidobacteriaceae bacterium]|nr:CPBP family intramembrane glutamic endopeptidase [Acidobacteriaceae bacterium]